MPVELDPAFVNAMSALLENARAAAAAATGDESPAWFLGDLDAWSGDALQVAAVGAAFARDGVGSAYSAALANGGTAGAAAGAKVQSDYLALAERAFRMRHASPVRCRLQAAGRRLAHADEEAGVIARVVACAQDFLNAGGGP